MFCVPACFFSDLFCEIYYWKLIHICEIGAYNSWEKLDGNEEKIDWKTFVKLTPKRVKK